jgi:hypothetical protein
VRRLVGIVVAALVALGAPSALAAAGPALSVDAGADRHAISPDIYGMNFADPPLARDIGLPVDRWGGNRTETYNWRIGASNAGNDWYFENTADCFSTGGNWCAGGNTSFGWLGQVQGDAGIGARTLLTLPMVGYVAKDAPLGHPLTCGFPRSRFPAQDGFDPYDSGCGNGRSGGAWLAPTPTDAGTPFGPADAAAWVSDATPRGVGLYELGNEPMLWSETHHALHPARATYDELWARSRDLAAAVKQADPGAQTLGPSEWGWPNYFCSDADVIANGCSASSPDRGAHGGQPLVEFYLDQMRAYQQQHGTRLLDYLDLHYYAQGGVGTTDITRSLWDPTYTDPSWINDRITLLPRMRAWVDQHYPGTKTALSEYDLTGFDNDGIVGTLVQADTLGIFAREGLDLATRWAPPSAGQRQADAWRIFRDYDGAGGRFGSTWVRSASADQSRLAVYGAQRADGALTVLVINKTTDALDSRLTLQGTTPGAAAGVYRWSGAGIARAADWTVSGGGVDGSFPARSLTLLVIPATVAPGSPAQTLTPVDPPAPAPTTEPAPAPLPAVSATTAATSQTARHVCVVPKLTGRTLTSARRALQRAGCAPGRIGHTSRRGGQAGRVVSQSPKAGRRVREGARVTVLVRRR